MFNSTIPSVKRGASIITLNNRGFWSQLGMFKKKKPEYKALHEVKLEEAIKYAQPHIIDKIFRTIRYAPPSSHSHSLNRPPIPSTEQSVLDQIPVLGKIPDGHKVVCIIGTGPAAMYTAKYLLQSDPYLSIHMIDKSQTPFGLVRYGIAPDHPEAKAVVNDYSLNVLDNPRVTLICGIEVGKHVQLQQLRDVYNSVILAVGAPKSRPFYLLNDIDGITTCGARAFVDWYNGDPNNDYVPAVDKIKHLIIVGNGNVSLDIARMMLMPPQMLMKTDIPPHVRKTLDSHSVREIHILGRRGPLDAAFTIAELREITDLVTAQGGLHDVPYVFDDETLTWAKHRTPLYQIQYHLHIYGVHMMKPEEILELPRPLRRKMELLQSFKKFANVNYYPSDGKVTDRIPDQPASIVNNIETIGVQHRHLHLHFNSTPNELLMAHDSYAYGCDGLQYHITGAPKKNRVNFLLPPDAIMYQEQLKVYLKQQARRFFQFVKKEKVIDKLKNAYHHRKHYSPPRKPEGGTTLMVKSTGFVPAPFKGIPYNYEKHFIPHENGRVIGLNREAIAKNLDNPHLSFTAIFNINEILDADSTPTEKLPPEQLKVERHLHLVGWAKTGGKGIIATHIPGAKETSAMVLGDLAEDKITAPKGDVGALWGKVKQLVVDYPGWKKIDHYERSMGKATGCYAVKPDHAKHMIDISRREIESIDQEATEWAARLKKDHKMITRQTLATLEARHDYNMELIEESKHKQ